MKVDLGVISDYPIITGNTIRYESGIQISHGTNTIKTKISTPLGGIFTSDGIIDAIGFDKSFIKKPDLTFSVDSLSSVFVLGCRKNANGILGVKFGYAQNVSSPTDITFSWVAVGRWK